MIKTSLIVLNQLVCASPPKYYKNSLIQYTKIYGKATVIYVIQVK